MVDPVCHRLCSRGSLLSLVNDPALFGCLRHLSGLLECVVDGVDRTECCASNGMSGQCLGACSGNATDLPASLLACQAHMFTFASCYDVPLPPLSPSPELSTTTSRTTSVSSARDAQFTSCCVAEGVDPYCYKLCSYNGLFYAEEYDLILCSSNLRRIAACGTNGDNVTQCCASNGLTGECLDICSGDIANFPADVLDCQQYIDTYALCYDVLQSTTSAPTTSARRCPPTSGCTSFSLRCQYGLARDDAGCEICSCHEPCRKVECVEGSVCRITSRTVCELDMCHLEYSGQCEAVCEPLNCSNPYVICRYGHVKNSTTGCDTCPCHQPCRNVTCEQGYVCEVNSHRACNGGVCNNEYRSSCVVDCPALDCGMYHVCPYGFVRNADGCETCQCYEPCEGATCPAGTACLPLNTPIIVADNGRYRRVYTYSCTPMPSSPAPPPTTTTPACQPVMCRMYCRFGWVKDNITGCDICACRNPCQGVTCQPGSVCEPTVENDTYVGLCVPMPSSPAPTTTTPACKPVMCRMLCPFGWAKDSTTGCDICACHNPCDGVTCQPGSVCEPTVEIDTYVGLCVPTLSTPTAATTPACQPVLCEVHCPFGWAKDLNTGCDICKCHNPCHDVRCHPGSECQPTLQGDRHVGVCVESTTTVSRARDEQFRSCCERDVADPVCRRLCSYDSLLSNFDDSDYFVCLDYLRSLVGCATAGVDRTECCASKGVSGQCLNVCSGNVTNLPTNYFDCVRHLSSFASCYDIPMPETPPLECPLLKCAMHEECQYGFAKNEYGCQTCECYDPCQGVSCESNFRCEPELRGESYHGVCVESTTTVSRTRDEQFRSCCERDVAHPVCRRLCSYDSLLSNFDDSDYFVCLVYLRSLVGCATAGVDRTECCASKGVSGQCLDVCTGNVTNFPTNYFDCMRHLPSFASCYDIPMPETPPLECPLVNCAMDEECQYGFAKNEYGCQTCECYDPCQRVFCESDFRCEPELRGESYHGVCVAEHPRINGVIKIDADFSIIDNKEKFKREIEKQISGILKLHDYVFKITGLRRGSILADFTVSAPANMSDDTAVDLLSHWTYDVKLTYNGAEYTTRLLSHSVARPTATSPPGTDKNFLLLVVLVPTMVPVCLIIVVVVVVLACKMQKVERNLLSSSSRTSSVAGDSFVDDNDRTKGFDNPYCVSIDDNRAAGGASEA